MKGRKDENVCQCSSTQSQGPSLLLNQRISELPVTEVDGALVSVQDSRNNAVPLPHIDSCGCCSSNSTTAIEFMYSEKVPLQLHSKYTIIFFVFCLRHGPSSIAHHPHKSPSSTKTCARSFFKFLSEESPQKLKRPIKQANKFVT